MKNILITTTNSFEDRKIEEYIDIVSTNVVVGTNFFSDFGASFTDFFGGYSDTYERKLQNIYCKAIENLKSKTKDLQGNAIIGLKIDFDEISGKGKSMFMVSAIAMAVKLSQDVTEESSSFSRELISCDELANAIIKSHIIAAINNNMYLDEIQWRYLLKHPISQVLEVLLTQYISLGSADGLGNKEKLLLNNFENLLAVSNRDDVMDVMYTHISKCEYVILNFIKTLKLFSAKHILDIFSSDYIDMVVSCLEAEKGFYTKEDLVGMNGILEHIDALEDQGRIEMSKGVFSKEKEKFICVCGAKNGIAQEYCGDCLRNKKGLRIDQVRVINEFKEKVLVLSELLK